MTNTEAIKLLSQIRDALLASNSWLPSTDNPIKESFGMAINALTQEAWKEEHPVSPLLQKPALTAQPETHEKRTETHGVCLDTISRQAAIDAHYEYCNKHPDAGFPVWSLKILEDLPSAQPEIIRCKDCIFHGLCRTSPKWAVAPKDDWFCADAERRTDESD